MGNAQCTSVHNAKYSFESIESSLSKGKSPLEQSILKEYQSIKYGLYLRKTNDYMKIDECVTSKKSKTITSYIDIETKKNIFMNWIQIIASSLYEKKQNNQSDYDKIIEERLLSFYNEKNKKFKELVALGCPECIRSIAWMICANIPVNRDSKLYEEFLNEDIDSKTEEQIKKDLNRTYFQNVLFP